MKWFWGVLKRYSLLLVGAGGAGQVVSWLFAADDAVVAWLTSHRGETGIMLFLSFVVYFLYEWFEEQEEEHQ
jgi:hypothetical protein